jgi:hypothetical protein
LKVKFCEKASSIGFDMDAAGTAGAGDKLGTIVGAIAGFVALGGIAGSAVEAVVGELVSRVPKGRWPLTTTASLRAVFAARRCEPLSANTALRLEESAFPTRSQKLRSSRLQETGTANAKKTQRCKSWLLIAN